MALVLKIVREDMTSYGGFKWPSEGPVECPDWDPKPACGQGLHGWESGEGSYVHNYMTGKWLIVEVNDEDLVNLDGKVKFRQGTVLLAGTHREAVQYLHKAGAFVVDSNPGWCCLTATQRAEVAFRAADRAVREYAPKALRARGHAETADKLAALPKICDVRSAYAAANAANAAYAANNTYDATNAAYAAANAANDTYDATNATYAADAATYATYAATGEREQQRKDRLDILLMGLL